MVTANAQSKQVKSKPLKNQVLRHAEYYDVQEVFDKLFADSQSGTVFDNLMDFILSRENILLAYRNIKRNDGSVTPGTDGLTIRNLARVSSEQMVQKVRNISRNYSPRAVRRKDIPKAGSPDKTRPLGIPCIWDRLVQQCILQVLEPICEARFSNNSYGFRPNRCVEHAIAESHRLIQRSGMHFVVEFDIKSFFDEVNHSKLMKQMWAMGIRDKKLIYVIRKILAAPIQMPDGTIFTPQKGTPQGGILSPLLANIVLNELDQWVDSQWLECPVKWKYAVGYNKIGTPIFSSGYGAMRKTRLKEMYIIRYADDFRIFCRTKETAERAKIAITQWLAERLRLEVSVEKTRVVNLKRQYSYFLGFKMKAVKRKRKFVVRSHVSEKAMKRISSKAVELVKAIQHATNGQELPAIRHYNAFVIGEHNYYRIATKSCDDFGRLAYRMDCVMKNRFGKKLTRKPGKVGMGKAIMQQYGKSAMVRYLAGFAVLPIGFVQTRKPLSKKKAIQKYTPEGRAEIHKTLGINTSMLKRLMCQELYGRSIEYSDNRISLYCAQYGKCAVTGQIFEALEEIHCHHKLPRHMGGGDEYQNLILVHKDVHTAIHATSRETIERYLAMWSLGKPQLDKLNQLRIKAGNEMI